MRSKLIASMIGAWACMCPVFGDTADPAGQFLKYTADGLLERPQHYREWVYLTTGFDMSYSADRQMGHHAFDNVFVDPRAYQAFVATGIWPDQTVLLIENRSAEGRGSINKSGHYQGLTVAALEVHVKDAARFAGGWAFFEFGGNEPAKIIPKSEECYSCHTQHAAVDTTFVQFYPTLQPIARAKGTYSERD